jgi:hypothetical protein
VLELYLQVNAHPRNEGGLAPTTYERYEETIDRHLRGRPRRRAKGATPAPKPYALAVAVVPAVSFNGRRRRGRGASRYSTEAPPKPPGSMRGAYSRPP